VCDLGPSESMSSDELASFALETEWFGDSAGPFYWQQWLELLKTQGVPVLTGYLGGIVGGSRLLSWGVPRGKLSSSAEVARDDVARHPFGEGRALIPFGKDAFQADLREGVGARLANLYCSLRENKRTSASGHWTCPNDSAAITAGTPSSTRSRSGPFIRSFRNPC
jgi:hypothetical protein